MNFSGNVLPLALFSVVQSPPVFVSIMVLLPFCLLKDGAFGLNQCEESWTISGTAADSHAGLCGWLQVGLVYMFNLIVGTGALTMPKAFATAGWLVSLVLLMFLGFMR